MAVHAFTNITLAGGLGYLMAGKQSPIANALYFAAWEAIKTPFSLLTALALSTLFSQKEPTDDAVTRDVEDLTQDATETQKEVSSLEALGAKKISSKEDLLKVAISVSLVALSYLPIAYLTRQAAPLLGFAGLTALQTPLATAFAINLAFLVGFEVVKHLLGCLMEATSQKESVSDQKATIEVPLSRDDELESMP